MLDFQRVRLGKPRNIYGVPYYSDWRIYSSGHNVELGDSAREQDTTPDSAPLEGSFIDPDDLDHLWMTRDQDARGQLVEALRSIDDTFRWMWNVDNRCEAPPSSRAKQLKLWGADGADDLAICTTRVPLDDRYDKERKTTEEHPKPKVKTIREMKTPLEDAVFAATRIAWRYITREKNELNKTLAEALHDNAACWQKVWFSELRYGRVEKCATEVRQLRGYNVPRHVKCSLGYLLYLPVLSEDANCQWLNVFSHAGLETLIWAHLIRFVYRDVLLDILQSHIPRLLVACFQYPDENTRDPEDFRFIPSRIIINAAQKCQEWYDYGPVHEEPYLNPRQLPNWIT